MEKFLKGNYELDDMDNDMNNVISADEDFSKIFESKALEKLGGSIAFVMKSDKFIWDEENNDNR